MSLEKIGLMLFFKYYRHIDDVKTHLVSALREVLLALSSSVGFANRLASDYRLDEKTPVVESVLAKADTLLDFALKRFPDNAAPSAQEIERLKTEVLSAVLGIIDDEIAVLTHTKARHAQIQIEALQAIRRAFGRRAGLDLAQSSEENEPDFPPNRAVSTAK